MDIVERLKSWIPQVQDRYINVDWNPANRGFGAQCWDLAAHWSMYLGLAVINTGDARGRWPGWAGNMVDTFPQNAEVARDYVLVSPDQGGLPGDIPVWDDSYWYYPSTHVAVLIADKGAQLLCMSQNSVPARPDNPYPGDSTGPTTLQHLPRQGLIGFIRPRAGAIAAMGETSTPLEDDMHVESLSADALNDIADAILRRPVDKEGGGRAMLLDMVGSFSAVMDSVIRLTIEGVLNTPVHDVRTGGVTTLATQAGWGGADRKAITDAITASVASIPGVDAAAVSAAVKESLAGLQVADVEAVTAQVKGEIAKALTEGTK
jgi:hypothetical protein